MGCCNEDLRFRLFYSRLGPPVGLGLEVFEEDLSLRPREGRAYRRTPLDCRTKEKSCREPRSISTLQLHRMLGGEVALSCVEPCPFHDAENGEKRPLSCISGNISCQHHRSDAAIGQIRPFRQKIVGRSESDYSDVEQRVQGHTGRTCAKGSSGRTLSPSGIHAAAEAQTSQATNGFSEE